VIAAIISVIALAAWAIASRMADSATRPARASVPTRTSVLRSLTPRVRHYALGIMSLTPAEFQAAFGTGPTSVQGAGSDRATHPAQPSVPSVLRSLTTRERQYVQGILSLTPAQFQAAYGTSPMSVPGAGKGAPASTRPRSPELALPILPACGPRACWRGGTSTERAASHHS
jgi:hypothetical protein